MIIIKVIFKIRGRGPGGGESLIPRWLRWSSVVPRLIVKKRNQMTFWIKMAFYNFIFENHKT